MQIVLIYRGIKLTNTLCLAHLFKATHVVAEILLNEDSIRKIMVHAVFMQIIVYVLPLVLVDIELIDFGFKFRFPNIFSVLHLH